MTPSNSLLVALAITLGPAMANTQESMAAAATTRMVTWYWLR